MQKKPKNQLKPFIDALYEAEEDLEIQVRLKQSMFRKGNTVMLRTTYSAVDKQKYKGDLIFNQPLVERQLQKPRIVKPDGKIITPH